MIQQVMKQTEPFCTPFYRRRYAPSEGRQLDIPPLGMTALTWGLFMGVSSNLRYQAVFGLERVVDKTIARRVPQVDPLKPLKP